MINLGIIIAVVLLLVLVGGTGIYFLSRRSKYKYLFWVWSPDLSTHKEVKAKLLIDKNNVNHRYFGFKDNPSRLVMRDPQHWSGSRPVRWVILDENGEYQYISPVNKLLKVKSGDELKPIDDSRYLQTRIYPVERSLALEQLRNTQDRYTKPESVSLATMVSLVALAAVLIIGTIYGIGVFTKSSGEIADVVDTVSKMQSAHNANSLKILESMQLLTENLALMHYQLGNSSFTRSVGGYQP